MTSDRLWPVLVGIAALLAGAIVLEWVAANREARYDTITVADSVGAEEEDPDELADQSWQAATPISSQHARARQLLRRGELDEALAQYRQVTQAPDAPVTLLTEYAYALRRADHCEEAAEVAALAVQRAPNDGAVNLSYALTQRCVDNVEAARAAFERALELRPNHTLTRLAYGELLSREGDLARAVAVLEPATRAGDNEERARALADFGRALYGQGELERGRAALDEAIERAPSVVAIWTSVARTYLLSPDPLDYSRALTHATRASQLAPELPGPYSLLGRTYEKLGLTRRALTSYQRAVALDGGYEYAHSRLVRLALGEEDLEVASRSAAALLEIDPNRATYHYLSGLVSLEAGAFEAAREALTEAIRLREGRYAEAWLQLGALEREVGDLEAAKEAYRQALEARPRYATAWNSLGLIHLDLAELDEAEAAFRRAAELEEGYTAPWSNLARVYSEHGRHDEAVEAYRHALELNPEDRLTRLRLGIAYRRAGREEDAIRLYRQLTQDEPRYVAAWYNLGIALSAAGRDTEARLAYEEALAVDPDHRASLKNLGLLEARLGFMEEAWQHLTDALDRDPSDTPLRLRIARMSMTSGNLARCAREARAVLAQDPSNEEAASLAAQCGRPQ